MSKGRALLAVFIAAGVLLSGGCVKRNLFIKSNPPGATVYFNGKEIGETPLNYDFLWYATHRIALKKEGYEPIKELVLIKAPFYLWLPLDLICELIPYTFRDERELSYTLSPAKEEP